MLPYPYFASFFPISMSLFTAAWMFEETSEGSVKKVFDRIQFNSFVEIMQNIPRNKGEQPWQE